MKRIVLLGFLVVLMFLWYRGRPSFANGKGPATWETAKVTLRSVKLEFKVLRLWNSTADDPSWPELALVRLPPKAYEEFREDPKGLIDGASIFNAQVHITGGCLLPEAKENGDADNTSWLVTLEHKSSYTACTAILQHRMP